MPTMKYQRIEIENERHFGMIEYEGEDWGVQSLHTECITVFDCVFWIPVIAHKKAKKKCFGMIEYKIGECRVLAIIVHCNHCLVKTINIQFLATLVALHFIPVSE